jgi:MFS family permease
MFARYVAADVASPAVRARAIAAVLAAVSVGAVAGPNLVAAAAGLEHWGWFPAGTGAYVIAAVGFAVTTAAWSVGLDGGVAPVPDDGVTRQLTLADRTRQRTGIGVLSLANLVMVATMTMAPVQMRMHDESGLGLVALVVSAHIAAMFGPSALSGRLVDRYGDRVATLVSCVLLTAATGLAALSGTSTGTLFVAMVLLGLGWNVATVTGSALLTRGVPLRQRARLEGRGEIGMGVAAAMGGGLSGVVMDAGGYPALATIGLGVVVFALLPLGIRRAPVGITHADCESAVAVR